MIIDDVDLIYENYRMINSKFVPTVTNPELFKEICDTKNAEEIAELIKNGQMPAYQDVNEVVKVWTSGCFIPSVMAANSIKSIEDAKKLDRSKILELIEPGMGWNDVSDAMPCLLSETLSSSPWNECISYKVVCCTLHYNIPLNRLFFDQEDLGVDFEFYSNSLYDATTEILYKQKIPVSYCFSETRIKDVGKNEDIGGGDLFGSVTFKRFINPNDIFAIEWYTGRSGEISDEYGNSDDNLESERLPYNNPRFKYQIQKF